MKRENLKKFIDLYKEVDKTVFELDRKFGINIWNSTKPNFYNNYNLLIHNLLLELFDEEAVNLIEEFCFDQTDFSFDELCNKLNI